MASTVVLHVVIVKVMYVSARDFAGYTVTPGTPALDQMYHAGDVLPAGLSEAAVRHFAQVGLTRPVIVRI